MGLYIPSRRISLRPGRFRTESRAARAGECGCGVVEKDIELHSDRSLLEKWLILRAVRDGAEHRQDKGS